MESIFTDAGIASIVQRIDRLSPTVPAQWGKMNVAQMLAHCQPVLKVGLNDHNLPKYNFMLRAIGRMVKKSLLKNELPYKRNQPTDKSFKIADARDFDTEKSKLKAALNDFSSAGRASQLIGDHPFFGTLSHSDWDKMQWKHLDHHLRQFGV